MSEVYPPHLDRVSRSFAFCIAQLRDPLKSRVGLSYLLCRVLDTIEDAAWANKEAQFQAYATFDQALADVAQRVPKDWDETFPPDLPGGERALLRDANQLFADYHATGPEVRAILNDAITSMSRGMQYFTRAKEGPELRLKTPTEVNQYCFFVAGVVGELLARLLKEGSPDFDLNKENLVGAHHFGQFLQKVNVLKDQVVDEKQGRHLVPARARVEISAAINARRAFEFLEHLPKQESEFKRFCAWSLFLGLESLRLARDSKREGRVLKLGRNALGDLLGEIEPKLECPQELQVLFKNSMATLGWTADLKDEPESSLPNQEVPRWLENLYRGGLGRIELASLGL